MNIKLVKLSKKYTYQLNEMLDEWTSFKNDNPYNLTPWSIFKNDYHDFDIYLNNLEVKNDDTLVPDSTFFCLDLDLNVFVGAVNIRHYLNDYLFNYGGHIGDGIRPSKRNMGYGSKMIALALDECRKLKTDKVLMVCNKNNIASRKTILKNGGVLDNEVELDNDIFERYWIKVNV